MTAITNQKNNIFRKRRDKQVPTSVGGGVSAGGGSVAGNAVDLSGFATIADLDAYYTKVELDAGQLDNRYYTETESDARYYTKAELDAGQLDNRYYTETEADNRFVHLTGDETIEGIKTFTNGIKAYSAESTAENFSSGFAGAGWKVDHNNEATFDTLNVRGTMNVYELMIQQIRASNGSIWVSDAMRYELDFGSDATTWKIGVDTDNGNRYTPFQAGDIIKAQRWTGKNIKSTILVVDSVDTTDEYVNCLKSLQIGSDPVLGDDFVRIGSTTNADRRGALYMTASDSGNPFLDVVNGLSTAAGSFTTKARLGKLDGITDADAGLNGSQSNYYGLYSDNVHLKGHIYSKSGNIGGWSLDNYGITHSESGTDKNMYIWNNEVTGSQWYGRGLTMYNSDGATPDGGVKIISLGQLRNKDTYATFPATPEYGFEVIKKVSAGNHKHIVRFGESDALIGPWEFNEFSFKKDTGTESTSAGLAPEDYPFYAGSQYANRSSAPFRVKNDGTVVATKFLYAYALSFDVIRNGDNYTTSQTTWKNTTTGIDLGEYLQETKTLRIRFRIKSSTEIGTVYGQVMRNRGGVRTAVGTERSANYSGSTFTEDIAGWQADDIIYLRLKSWSTGTNCEMTLFALQGTFVSIKNEIESSIVSS